ncbi:MAG: VOC family protein [Candidatus Dactylopiibacterium sp.]|nr:VOC family protein [Candidatus Dactylopiibacterium sp.]
MALYQGIEHVAVFSTDTARLRDWYAAMLDMKPVLDNGAGNYFMLMADGSLIELSPTTQGARSARPHMKDSGLRHIALSVDGNDFGAAVHRLVEAGVEAVGDSPRQFPDGMATFHFRDPDGNILHLISRPRRLSLGVAPQLSGAPVNTLVQGIEHTCIMARNPEALRQWYIDALGFQLIVRDDGHGTAFVLGADGRSIIEFIQAEADAGIDPYKAAGIRHIAIRVSAAEAATAAARLKPMGVEILEDYVARPDGVHLFFFRDPEGNVLHLVGRTDPLLT